MTMIASQDLLTQQTKQCPMCGIIKPLDNFFKDVSRKDGLQYACKQCDCLRRTKHIMDNPVETITSGMLKNARNRAKKKNLAFNLDIDYVRSLVCSHCSLLPNISLDWSLGNKKTALPNSPSLDRIDPTKGYVKGNVWIVSHRGNAIKNDATHDELKAIAENTGRALANSLDW